MKHLVMKGDKVLEVTDDYAEAWGALVYLRASHIETVSDDVANKAKAEGHYKFQGYVLKLDANKFYPKFSDGTK